MRRYGTQPIFPPRWFQLEMDTMSKNALIDLVWDFAASAGESCDDDDETIATIRDRAAIVLRERGDRNRMHKTENRS